MRRGTIRTRGGAALLVAALVCALPATDARAASEDPEWPCIQRKVPHVSAGMVWAGPPIDEEDETWQEDEALRRVAAQAASRRTDLERAKQAVADFAAGLDADRNERLTRLFAGILALVNAERDSVIAGIERYARRQRALAERIAAATAELEALELGSEDAERRREELAQQIQWDTRIFDEREHSLRYVCEQPVLLEQRVFALGREVMSHLE